MEIKRAFLLFEQSGTWKNEFIKLGIDAMDYDILNNFGETDHVCDLFSEIEKSYGGGVSLFDEIHDDDLVVAFFPCTRFEARVPLLSRGDAFQQKNWSDNRKLEYSMELHDGIHSMYMLICKLFHVFNSKRIRAVVENPYTQPHHLTTYFPIRPSLIDKDRTENGDYYKKPTQYWFVNCVPENNLVFEPIDYVRTHTISNAHEATELVGTRAEKRSLMHPQYANRFIRRYLLDNGERSF